jgi:hypothetical protein
MTTFFFRVLSMRFRVRGEFNHSLLIFELVLFHYTLAGSRPPAERIEQIAYVCSAPPYAFKQNLACRMLPFKTIKKSAAVQNATSTVRICAEIVIADGTNRENA